MGSGPQPPVPSPHVFYDTVDNFGKRISITMVFDNITRLLSAAQVHRDPGCQWTRILIGLGPDGTAESTPHQFVVPDGDSVVLGVQLARNGLSTMEDVNALQVTAGL